MKVYSKVSLKTYKKVSGKTAGTGGGIMLPPVRDKLLLWASGKLQDGATVDWEDPAEDWVDPAAPWGVYRRDSYKALGDFPMKTSQSHCCELNGVDDYIDMGGTFDLSGDFSISINCIFANLASGVLISDASTTDVIIFDVALGYIRWKVDGTDKQFNLIPLTDNYYKFSRVGDTFTITSTTQSQSIEVPGAGNQTVRYLGRAGGGLYFNGLLWNVVVDGNTFPLSEGAGTTVHTTDGSLTGDIVSSDVPLLWGSYQDDYHYNVASGFWENGDGVKYPYAVSGFTSVHPAGKWNGAESKYQYRDDALMIAADLLEGEFFFTAGVATPRTQAEIEAYVVDKESVFFCASRGLKQYNAVLTGDDLYKALSDCGDTEILFDGAEALLDGTDTIYDRV